MPPPYSLSRRLCYGFAAVVAVAWLAGALLAAGILRHELDEVFDSALQETAQQLLALAAAAIPEGPNAHPLYNPTIIAEHREFLVYSVFDHSGAVLLRSHDVAPGLFPPPAGPGFADTATHRIYSETTRDGRLTITIADPLHHRRGATLEAALVLTVPPALLLPLSLFGVWRLVRRAMRPLLGLRGQIEARGAGDLSPLDVRGLPEETRPVAESVNNLMKRLHQSLRVERSFAVNSAHELRTPIAGALAQAQRLRACLDGAAEQTRVRELEGSLRRLARIQEKLMQLARAEGAAVLSRTRTDLGPALRAVVEEFHRQTAHAGRLRFSGVDPGALTARMDADAFGVLMRNLLENALKHGAADGVVEVSATVGRVRVVNDAAVIAADILQSLTEPFVRASGKVSGGGLGLAIAQTIAANGGAKLTLLSPATGRTDGFEAIVDFDPPAPFRPGNAGPTPSAAAH